MILTPPDLPNIPNIQPELAEYLRRVTMWAAKQFTFKVPIDTATHGVLLQSPSGKVYAITVDDSGTLIATLVPLGSHP